MASSWKSRLARIVPRRVAWCGSWGGGEPDPAGEAMGEGSWKAAEERRRDREKRAREGSAARERLGRSVSFREAGIEEVLDEVGVAGTGELLDRKGKEMMLGMEGGGGLEELGDAVGVGLDVLKIVIHDGGRGATVTVQVLLAREDMRRIVHLAPELRLEGSGGGSMTMGGEGVGLRGRKPRRSASRQRQPTKLGSQEGSSGWDWTR